jgi:hypothetical protein
MSRLSAFGKKPQFLQPLTGFSSPSAETDTAPDFTVTWSLSWADGDIIHIEYRTGADAYTDYVQLTLTAAEIIADEIEVPSIGPLSDATYDFRARVERGSLFTEWSTLQFTVNAV